MAQEEDFEYYPFRWKVADAAEDLLTLHRGKLVIASLLLLGGLLAGVFLWGGDGDSVETTAPPASTEDLTESSGNEDENGGTTSTTVDEGNGTTSTAPTTSSSTTTTTSSTTSTTTTTTEPARPPGSAEEIAAAQPGNIIDMQPGVVTLVGGLPSEANAQETLTRAEQVFGTDVEIVDAQIVDASFPVPDGSVTYRLSAADLFGYNSDNINSTYLPTIDQLASALQANDAWTVTVTGHTDSEGPSEGNQRLSQRRAQAGANRLTAQDVASGRITVVGAGEDQPIATNSTEAGRLANRRIEFTVQ